MMSETKLLVAAIDFGSSGAGYAFSFAYQYKANPIDIQTSIWSDNNISVMTKIPSVLLFDSKKKFHSFGFDAEDKYEDLVNTEEHTKWYYFKGFKMQLYNAVENEQDIRDDFELFEVGRKKMSAKIVFTTAIKFLKDHLDKEIKQRNLGAVGDMLYWVVSVPAIWNDSCKQFMRECAENAGIDGEKFSIVYEPEAASVYARLLPVDKFVSKNNAVMLKTFDLGRKFIVLDAGGGTVDISTQEVSTNGELKIIHKVCGGPWGGECVNRLFMKILFEVLGSEVLEEFGKSYGHDLLQLTRHFERKKKTFKIAQAEKNSIQIPVPYSLVELSEMKKNATFSEIIATSKYNQQLRFKRDKLTVDPELFKGLFDEPVCEILKEIKKILSHERCSEVSAIMMAGGFSEADILQQFVQEAFPTIEVFIPVDGSLSVLKGAVIFGHNPSVVSSRICNFTYGVGSMDPFDEDIHRLDKFTIYDGEFYCRDIFSILYVIDDEVKVGESRSIPLGDSFRTPERQLERSKPITVNFYVCDRSDPFYTTDEGVRKHGTIIVDPPPGQIWPTIVSGIVELQIAGTEMIGSFIYNGKRTSVKFEFLPAKSLCPDRKRIFDPFNFEI